MVPDETQNNYLFTYECKWSLGVENVMKALKLGLKDIPWEETILVTAPTWHHAVEHINEIDQLLEKKYLDLIEGDEKLSELEVDIDCELLKIETYETPIILKQSNLLNK